MNAVARRPKKQSSVREAPVAGYSAWRLLLDTHVWLWWQSNDARLGPDTRRILKQASEVRFSTASAWEIAIKISVGKLTLPKTADIAVELAQSDFIALPVELRHTDEVRRLPVLHRDPFDRMLVAQARAEGLTLVTADDQLSAYGVATINAKL